VTHVALELDHHAFDACRFQAAYIQGLAHGSVVHGDHKQPLIELVGEFLEQPAAGLHVFVDRCDHYQIVLLHDQLCRNCLK